MRDYAQDGEFEGEAIDEAEQDLEADDEVYETRKKSFGENSMFLDQLREIIESGSCSTPGKLRTMRS